MGVKVPCHGDILYGIFTCEKHNYNVFWICICITIFKLWKTRCKMEIDKCYVDSETVFKHIKTELKRRRTMDLKKGQSSVNWSAVNL